MERYKAREVELWFAISCNNEKRSLLWYPDAFSVWSKEKPSLLTIRKLLHQDRFLVFSLLVITTLFIHTIISRHTHRGEYSAQCCSILQHRAHTRDRGFLCRKQSQLCLVRIGSQWERGGWYDVSPPHRPFVRNRRAQNQEAGWRAWSESGNWELLWMAEKNIGRSYYEEHLKSYDKKQA